MLFCRVAIVVIYLLNLGIALGKHGETELKRYNFWTTFIGSAIGILLLWGGGFFA